MGIESWIAVPLAESPAGMMGPTHQLDRGNNSLHYTVPAI
jgi:hypothetical protein